MRSIILNTLYGVATALAFAAMNTLILWGIMR